MNRLRWSLITRLRWLGIGILCYFCIIESAGEIAEKDEHPNALETVSTEVLQDIDLEASFISLFNPLQSVYPPGLLRIVHRVAASNDEVLDLLSNEDQSRIMQLVSHDGRQYTCVLPSSELSERTEYISSDEETTVPMNAKEKALQSRLESMMTLLQGECMKRKVGWWTYEICIGDKVMQYHEEKSNPSTQEKVESHRTAQSLLGEYSSGNLDMHYWKEYLEKTKSQSSLPSHTPSSIQEASWVEIYDDGSFCEASKGFRKTIVRYVCNQAIFKGKSSTAVVASIFTLREIKTCVYEIVIATSVVCVPEDEEEIPAAESAIICFKPEEARWQPLVGDECQAMSDEMQPRPLRKARDVRRMPTPPITVSVEKDKFTSRHRVKGSSSSDSFYSISTKKEERYSTTSSKEGVRSIRGQEKDKEGTPKIPLRQRRRNV